MDHQSHVFSVSRDLWSKSFVGCLGKRNLEGGDLGNDVLVGVVQPLIKGDGAVGVGVHGGEVLLPLGKTLLQNIFP